MKDLTLPQRTATRKAMDEVWQKWLNSAASQALSEDEFAGFHRDHPNGVRAIDTWWVLTSPGSTRPGWLPSAARRLGLRFGALWGSISCRRAQHNQPGP